MKPALATLLIVPALALAAGSALPPAQQQLFDTERAFVRAAAEKGFRDSFYEYFADDGIAFNPHPFRVRVSLAGQPSTPPPMGADWAPVWGDIAAAGDLGWNTGPLLYPGRDGKPDRHGLFFSVWKRQTDGSFKVVLDIGSDTPAAVVPITEPPHTSWREGQGTPGGVDVAAAKAALLGAERDFLAVSSAESLGRAYASRLADEARVHRPGVMPVTGRVAIGEWAGAQAGQYRGEPLFADVSKSGELGYAWGSYERIGEDPDAGYFARVWKKDARGDWRIVFDTVSPVPAGTKPLTAELMRAETPYLEGRWADAEAAYRQFVEANPENAFAWNRLGTSQVQQKKYAEAVQSLERAIAIGGGGPVDFYNLACAYALAGNPDKALDNVERAIGAGVRRRAQFETDPDLASLRERPRFKALMQPL
ncbi:MAG TPA: tetratricopeptide repeat protein [Steroidobacteraceae bacterium]|nr:tetratricopeptide repeat protein [Steroidobacteraceae bacterium]